MFLGKSITLHPIYDPPPVRCHSDFLSDSKLPPPPYKEVPLCYEKHLHMPMIVGVCLESNDDFSHVFYKGL